MTTISLRTDIEIDSEVAMEALRDDGFHCYETVEDMAEGLREEGCFVFDDECEIVEHLVNNEDMIVCQDEDALVETLTEMTDPAARLSTRSQEQLVASMFDCVVVEAAITKFLPELADKICLHDLIDEMRERGREDAVNSAAGVSSLSDRELIEELQRRMSNPVPRAEPEPATSEIWVARTSGIHGMFTMFFTNEEAAQQQAFNWKKQYPSNMCVIQAQSPLTSAVEFDAQDLS